LEAFFCGLDCSDWRRPHKARILGDRCSSLAQIGHTSPCQGVLLDYLVALQRLWVVGLFQTQQPGQPVACSYGNPCLARMLAARLRSPRIAWMSSWDPAESSPETEVPERCPVLRTGLCFFMVEESNEHGTQGALGWGVPLTSGHNTQTSAYFAVSSSLLPCTRLLIPPEVRFQ